MTGRAVPEWVGKTPDTPAPPRVRLRVLLRFDRKCYLSGQPIADGVAWDIEHVKPLHDGGENRESNLAPALVAPHRDKTRAERKRKAKAEAAAKLTTGMRQPSKHPIRSRGFPTTSTKRQAHPIEPGPRRGGIRFTDE